jgi:hypothetical protein
MDIPAIVIDSVWSALVAAGLACNYTAPARYLVATALCGFVGRLVRDVGVAWSLNHNWATATASMVVVLVAVSLIRRHTVSPVVLIAAVMPLGAALAMFNLIFALMQVSTLHGQALSEATVALSANLGRLFTTSLAIALGLGAGMVIVRLCRRGESAAV